MAGKKPRISLDAARAAMRSFAGVIEAEELPFEDSLGRIAAETVRAAVYVPAFDRSPLDGYALRAEDTVTAGRETPAALTVTEEIAAGESPSIAVTPGMAAKILTGAPIPEGADCVVRFEETEYSTECVKIFVPLSAKTNIVPMGDDIKPGDVVLNKGDVISAAHLGLLASVDRLRVAVRRRPKIALINTGNELTEPGEPMIRGEIRNSARYTIAAILRENGAEVEDGYIVRDEAEPLAELLENKLKTCDMVITTGGVSVGDYDMVRKAVSLLGGKELFWKVAFRPGGTILAANFRGKLILGLSGNPASAAIGLHLLGLPVVRIMAGCTAVYPMVVETRLLEPIRKDSRHGRLVRGRLVIENGRICFLPMSAEGHGAISSLIGCDMIASIPPGTPPLPAGETISAFWLQSLINGD